MYVLTQIAKDILQHVSAVQEIEQKKLAYRIKEIIETDKTLSAQDKQNVIRDLKLNERNRV